MEKDARRHIHWQSVSSTVLPNFTMECTGERNKHVYLNTTALSSLLQAAYMESPIRVRTARLDVPIQVQGSSEAFDSRGRTRRASSVETADRDGKQKAPPLFEIVSDHTNWHILIDTDALARKAWTVESVKGNDVYRVLLNKTLRKALHRTILQDKLTPEMYGKFNYFIRAIGTNAALASLGNFSALEDSVALYSGYLAATLLIFNMIANRQQDTHNSLRTVAAHRVHNRRTGMGLFLPALPVEQYLTAAAFLQTKGRKLIK